MFKRWLGRLGFVVATVSWTVLLYGALSVSLEERIGTPMVIGSVLVIAIVVAIAARLLIGKVF